MADIAFLLLIFFLVSTQILNEKGVKVLLPKYTETLPKPGSSNKKILKILINSENNLLVNNELSSIVLLKENIKQFILNPEQHPNLARTPDMAIISINSDDETSYETYVQVYAQLKDAYTEMWTAESLKKYSSPLNKLSKDEFEGIKKIIPLNISEVEKAL